MYYPHHPYPIYWLPDNRCNCQQPTYCFHQPQPYMPYDRVQYPEVDPALFHQSAGEFKKLMNEAIIILNKLSESEEFAYKVMNAAQQNKTEKVEKLIKSTGVQGNVEISYNPDGINIIMSTKVESTDCCKLEMAIRWR